MYFQEGRDLRLGPRLRGGLPTADVGGGHVRPRAGPGWTRLRRSRPGGRAHAPGVGRRQGARVRHEGKRELVGIVLHVRPVLLSAGGRVLHGRASHRRRHQLHGGEDEGSHRGGAAPAVAAQAGQDAQSR